MAEQEWQKAADKSRGEAEKEKKNKKEKRADRGRRKDSSSSESSSRASSASSSGSLFRSSSVRGPVRDRARKRSLGKSESAGLLQPLTATPPSKIGVRAHRELVTLATALDELLSSRIPHTLDILMQRFKALEAAIQGKALRAHPGGRGDVVPRRGTGARHKSRSPADEAERGHHQEREGQQIGNWQRVRPEDRETCEPKQQSREIGERSVRTVPAKDGRHEEPSGEARRTAAVLAAGRTGG